MRTITASLLALALAASLIVAGCGGKTIAGTWKMTGAKDMPPGATVTATFGPGDSMTINADMPDPTGSGGKIKMAIKGTYTLEGDVMNGKASDVSLTVEGMAPEVKAMVESQFNDETKKKMIEDFNKDSTGAKITWVDDKTFKTKAPNGNEATFEKQ
jgi:hypothetical protein